MVPLFIQYCEIMDMLTLHLSNSFFTNYHDFRFTGVDF